MGWGVSRDNAHHASAGRYQAFSQQAGLIADDAGDATRVPQDSRTQEERTASPPHEGLHGDLTDGADAPTWGRDGVRRPEGSGQGRPRAGQRFPREAAREGYGDAPVSGGAEQDDEDTRQWEADDHRDWPGQERSGWGGQSTRWNGGNPGARQGPDQRRLNGGGGGSDGDALAGRRSAARGDGAGLAHSSARGKRSPHPPQPPPPPPPPPPSMGTTALGEDAPHQNGTRSAAGRRERFKEEDEEDEFGDGQAWGDVDAADEDASEARLKRSNGSGGHQKLSGGERGGASDPWPRPGQQDSRARAGKVLQSAPPQSKLVQRVFGGLGRRGRGGGRGRGNAGRGGRGEARDGRGVEEDGGERGAGSESWALQAELQGKLQELEEEVRALLLLSFCSFFGGGADEGSMLLILSVG